MFTILQAIDPEITYELVQNLKSTPERPMVFKKVKNKLIMTSYDDAVKSLLYIGHPRIKWNEL